MRYAVIDLDGLVINVIELDPENHCTDETCAGARPGGCLKWHGPAGCVVLPAGQGPNTGDPATRPAGPGDRATPAPEGHHRPYLFHPAPKGAPQTDD